MDASRTAVPAAAAVAIRPRDVHERHRSGRSHADLADDTEAALAEYEEAKTALEQFIGPNDELARLKARRDTVHPSVPAVCVRAQCR